MSLKVSKQFQAKFKGVSRGVQVGFKEVSRVFHVCINGGFKSVSEVFEGRFKVFVKF